MGVFSSKQEDRTMSNIQFAENFQSVNTDNVNSLTPAGVRHSSRPSRSD